MLPYTRLATAADCGAPDASGCLVEYRRVVRLQTNFGEGSSVFRDEAPGGATTRRTPVYWSTVTGGFGRGWAWPRGTLAGEEEGGGGEGRRMREVGKMRMTAASWSGAARRASP